MVQIPLGAGPIQIEFILLHAYAELGTVQYSEQQQYLEGTGEHSGQEIQQIPPRLNISFYLFRQRCEGGCSVQA